MKEKLKEHLKTEFQAALKEMPRLTWSEFLQGCIDLANSKGFKTTADIIEEILKESF